MKSFVCCFLCMSTFAFVFFPGTPAEGRKTETSWYAQGISLEEAQNYEGALDALNREIDSNPACAEAYLRRGKLIFALNHIRCLESLENFTRVIALDKDNGNAYYERALIHLYMLHNEEGQRDMEHAARLGHNGAQVWLRSQRQKEAARGEKTAVDEQKSTSADVSVLHFEYNEATIKPSYIPLLESIGSDIQRSLAKITIVVTGHTDSTGSDSFNHHLSMRRAQAVKKYLTETYQIPPELISIEAYGESIPLAPNTSETNRALNRRVEITGIP